jgi:hypothetical protein
VQISNWVYFDCMISKGFVAISSRAIDDDVIRDYIRSWLLRFERVEQVSPLDRHGNTTLHIKGIEDYVPDDQVQFRVLDSGGFAWAYITRSRRAIETTGFADGNEISLCLEILLELPAIDEIIQDTDEARLCALEAEGML